MDMIGLVAEVPPALRAATRAPARRLPPAVLASPRYAPGSWRYYGCRSPRGSAALAIVVSVLVHVVFLFGFNHKPKPVRQAAATEEIIQIAMPDLQEDEPDKVEELAESPEDQAPAVSVPSLADVPSTVAVSTFVQPLQVQPNIAESLNSAKVAKIPVSATRGTGKGLNLGKVFEISQLDRAPSAITQPPPVFPYSLRSQISEGKVTLEFIVDANGDVVAPEVIASTHHGLDEAAIIGVLKWKFRPGMKAGRKVNTRVRQPLSFTVTEE